MYTLIKHQFIVLLCLWGFTYAQNSLPVSPDYFDISQMNEKLTEALNIYRAKKNISPLLPNIELSSAACTHSNEMMRLNFFSHINNRNKSLKTFENRAQNSGYNNYIYLGENIYYSKQYFDSKFTIDDLVDETIRKLAASAIHNKNMLNSRYQEAGVCVAVKISSDKTYYEFYVTQMFGAR